VGRAGKSEIAALAVRVLAVARGGDGVAGQVVRGAAAGLAAHAAALIQRLGPWSAPTPVVVNGGLTRDALFNERVGDALRATGLALVQRAAAADAVAGAVGILTFEG
jgi:N-acetylglucosamine kinase-like BadF-type ATPase